jgi:hypothetical protein
MALTPDNLLEPTGDLAPELFPGKDSAWIDTLLAAYLADGYARTPATVVGDDRDRAAAAWAYARAYRHVLARLSRTPATVEISNEGSTTMLSEQIRTFARLATRYESEYNGIIGEAPTPDDTPSAAATNSYVF